MTIAVDRMAERLTAPFGRGADRLALTLAPGARPAQVIVAPYDFAEHIARFGTDPEPRYAVTAQADVTVATTLRAGYEVLRPGEAPAAGNAALLIPGGTLAGMSAVLHLGTDEGAAVRLRTLTMDPPPTEGNAAERWGIIALLGNIAKLLWIMGWERDSVGSYMAQVHGQTRLVQAAGQTLDLFGFNLGVPRFPPLPYKFEPDAVALYHLDDSPGPQVQDAMTLYRGIGHPGTVAAARAGAAGRFGRGFSFADPAAEIGVADHPELGTDAAASFTAECFVKPDGSSWEGAVLSKHADPRDPTRPGWALSVGEFGRGIPLNVSFLVSDGPHAVTLFADRTLAAARFSHLAGVIDRTAQEARLYVDGTITARGSLTAVTGAPANAEPVRIGRAGAGPDTVFHGILDEVRLSRAARVRFAPVLGEDDDSYRRRLRTFERWVLPTPAGLQAALNDVTGEVNGVADPLIVDDTDSTLVEGSHPLTILPADLQPGESIDDLGRRDVTEADTSGTAAADSGFDPALLADGRDPRADFAAPPPAAPAQISRGLAAEPHGMRVGTLRTFRALLDSLQARGVAGNIQVRSGFDPAALDLRAVGRALVLAHEQVPPGQLAALAQRAGFTFTRYRADHADVYVSVRCTETVQIELEPGGGTATAGNGFDLLTGQTLALKVVPPLPIDVTVHWFTLGCGEGRADLTAGTDRAEVMVTATHPGVLIVEVQVTRRVHSYTSTRSFRVGIEELAAGQSISDAGALSVAESVVAAPDDAFDYSSYLVSFADPRVSFGTGASARRMQPVLAARLLTLLDLLPGGKPAVTAGWNPAGSGPERVGRAITVEQGTAAVSLARLGALAHAAGFSYAASDGTRLRLLQASGELVRIDGPDHVDEGGSASLALLPRAAPSAVALAGDRLWTVNTGTETLSVIDTVGGQVTAAVKVGLRPVATAASPDGGRLYTADGGAVPTVTVVNTVGPNGPAVAGTIDLDDAPVGLAHHPADAKLYVALGASGRLLEVDTTSLTITRSLSLGDRPVALAFQPGASRLWVATATSAVRPVDTAGFTAGAAVALAGPPRDVAVGADRAYVTVPSERSLQVIGVATSTVEATFNDLGPSPERLALTPSGAILYVTDGANRRVYLRRADGSTQRLPGLPPSAPVAGTPTAATADDRRAYVTAAGAATDNVSVLDSAAEAALVALFPLGSGRGERLAWSVRPGGSAGAQLSSTTTPAVSLSAENAGPLLVRAVYQWPDHTPPYTFRVSLNAKLQDLEEHGANVVIRKDQYDLIMNILNELHPIGVEVDTRIVREHVLELRDSQLEVFPPYTYPDFRARPPRPPSVPLDP